LHQQISKLVRSSAKRSLSRTGDFLVRRSPLLAQPVIDSSHFPWATLLEKHFPVIRRELDRVMEFRNSLLLLHDLQREQYRISADDTWKVFIPSGWGR
jgi:beta-hydroxylase